MNKIPNRKAICDVLLKEAETDKDIVVLCSDSRASEICERIKTNVMIDPDREQKKNGGVAEIIRQKTGMHLSPYFPAAKFVWLQENVEEVKQAKRDNDLCLGTIDTWLLFKLTKGEVYATDYSNASRTQLFNIHNLK